MEEANDAHPLEAPTLPAEREPLPSMWDADQVGKALVRAFKTLDKLPRPKGPRGTGNHWVPTKLEWSDLLAQAELDEAERKERQQRYEDKILNRPSGVELKQMEAVFDWLRDLRDIDSGLALVSTLWALRSARGRSIKKLCLEKGWAPHTFFRKRVKALETLASMLNARGVPVF